MNELIMLGCHVTSENTFNLDTRQMINLIIFRDSRHMVEHIPVVESTSSIQRSFKCDPVDFLLRYRKKTIACTKDVTDAQSFSDSIEIKPLHILMKCCVYHGIT